jgi:hypothetical protein
VTPGMLFFADAVKVEVSGLLGRSMSRCQPSSMSMARTRSSMSVRFALACGRHVDPYGVLQESDLALERVELAPAPSPAAAQP